MVSVVLRHASLRVQRWLLHLEVVSELSMMMIASIRIAALNACREQAGCVMKG